MSVPAENSKVKKSPPALKLEVMLVDQWLIFDCPQCQQTIKLDRKDAVHDIECPSCGKGFEPLLDRDVKLPPRKVPARSRRRREPRGSEKEVRAPKKREQSKKRMTSASLPSEGMVKLTLTPAETSLPESDESAASKLPVRSALELERRRVEALETKPVQPDESELNAVIEAQSGGKYKRIRVRTRKKRLTEKQRMTKFLGIVGLTAMVLISLSIWVASQLYVSEDDTGEIIVDAEPIGEVIDAELDLLDAVLKAETVDQLLTLIRYPKRLEPTVRAYYGGNALPKLNVKSMRERGSGTRLPKDFSAYRMTTGSRTIPVYIEKTSTHGYRLDWESFVHIGAMPWDEFVASKPTKTTRMRVYFDLEEGTYYEPPFGKNRYHCHRIEDPLRKHTLYAYFDRHNPKFRSITDRYFELAGKSLVPGRDKDRFEIYAIVDIRFSPGASELTRQVELVEFVTESWLLR